MVFGGLRGAKVNVQVPAGEVTLEGELNIPEGLRGFVLFAHGSGSSRHSPRNQYVGRVLQTARIGTLLLDLLTREEDDTDRRTAKLRFNIGLLAKRLRQATDWVAELPQIKDIKKGYFGASTGAAAALLVAAELHGTGAVVSRGGRVDLAGSALPKVKAPTLLIVGGKDSEVVALNRKAMDEMNCEKRLEVVRGATHLFEEPGTLEEVARLAREWFELHLGGEGLFG